jgi:DNA polymerase-3 subunit beta
MLTARMELNMKFSCNNKELSEALTNIGRAVSSKSSLPALEGILIKTINNQIELSAYDLELGMTTSINALIVEPGDIILNAKLFSDLIRKLSADKTEISVDEKLLTIIKSGTSEFTILGIPASEFPELPSLTDGIMTSIPQEILSSMIRQTLFAISTDDSKPVLMGSLFEFSDNLLSIVSVDGARLAIRTEYIPDKLNLSFVVPGKTLSDISKMLDVLCEQPVIIKIGKRHIVFDINGYSIISRLLEGEFINYRNVINKQFNSEIKVKVRDFLNSVDRASLLISDRLKSPIKCLFDNGIIKISAATAIGKAYDEIPCFLNGNTVEMGFNNRYLLDALKALECDEIKIQLNGPLSPIKIYPLEGDDFIFLILPVRL